MHATERRRRAVTFVPGVARSARLEVVAPPDPAEGALVVAIDAIGVCGTDRELLAGAYGTAPAGRERLIIGHESLGHVLEAPADSGFAPGDAVAGIVRRPDPVPCAHCAIGEWDLCENGAYTERGIKGRDGYAAQIVRIEPDFAVRVDAALGVAGVLTEPASVVAKAWAEIERLAARSAASTIRDVWVTGAGPIGLLAALMGVQRGCDVAVYDRAEGGPKPALARDLGARYATPASPPAADAAFDVVIECTGAASVIVEAIKRLRPNGILCLTGVSRTGTKIGVDAGAINREMVLENAVVFGSVNARRTHYAAGASALAAADRHWLHRLVTRRVGLDAWRDAFEPQPDDVKVVLDFVDARHGAH
ncbi:alcohol dehydrogenase catalytic domain-containing protein [Dokdonella sp.]|uniref:alcohol dehydrogenase catalytic domain-containing protein n=1 Tax=Dokdonella sp. TaxID=2291710 RepID=UPI002F3FF943